jgi:riboflavin synthase alpha subunit
MFTGIVRELAAVEGVEGVEGGIRLRISAPRTAADARPGDSVALNGVCLTVVERADGTLAFDAVPETLSRTTLRRLAPGTAVNVEPALRAGEPLGGHIVQGHVDGVGRVHEVRSEGEGTRIEIEVPAELLRYLVEKGSIAVEGVSLTVAAVGDGRFAVALIPHTLAATTLGSLAAGDEVNLEADVLAKYVERALASRERAS